MRAGGPTDEFRQPDRSMPASHVVMLGESAYLWNGKGDPFRVVDGQQAFAFVLDVACIREELIRDIDQRAA